MLCQKRTLETNLNMAKRSFEVLKWIQNKGDAIRCIKFDFVNLNINETACETGQDNALKF